MKNLKNKNKRIVTSRVPLEFDIYHDLRVEAAKNDQTIRQYIKNAVLEKMAKRL